jgi:hypothetical protein
MVGHGELPGEGREGEGKVEGGAAWGGDSVPAAASVALCCYLLFMRKNTWGRKEREEREKVKKKRNGKFPEPGKF